MENEQITYAQKVYALQKANPKMTDQTACLLLGITIEKLQEERVLFNPLNLFGEIFKEFN